MSIKSRINLYCSETKEQKDHTKWCMSIVFSEKFLRHIIIFKWYLLFLFFREKKSSNFYRSNDLFTKGKRFKLLLLTLEHNRFAQEEKYGKIRLVINQTRQLSDVWLIENSSVDIFNTSFTFCFSFLHLKYAFVYKNVMQTSSDLFSFC